MYRWFIILFFSASAWAQLSTADQIPTVLQATQDQAVHALAFANNVVSGNLLIATYHARSGSTPTAISDTCSSTWTLRLSQGTGNSLAWTYTAIAACSGADTITFTPNGGSNEHTAIMEVAHLAELIDTTASTATDTSGSSQITFPNVTTSFYREFILDIPAGFCGYAGGNGTYTYALTTNDGGSGRDGINYSWALSGDPGTVTGPTINCAQGASLNASEGVIAFRTTSALTVSTQAIPDAVNGTAYSFQLQATGGTGTNVWTTTSGTLPCGLSLSSGGVISGTPTCSNANTITFKVTDAATANATKNLTIQVGNSTSTVVRLQGKGQNGTTAMAMTSNVASGSLMVVGIAQGSSAAQTGKITDSLGTVYYEIPGAVLWFVSGNHTMGKLYWGFTSSSGADTITFTGFISTAVVWAEEFSNVQHIFDTGVVSKINSNGGGSIVTAAITAPIAETLYGVANPVTSGSTATASAPFTAGVANLAGGTNLVISTANQIGAASGSQTATWTVTGNSGNNWDAMLLGFRPTSSGTAPGGHCGGCELSGRLEMFPDF